MGEGCCRAPCGRSPAPRPQCRASHFSGVFFVRGYIVFGFWAVEARQLGVAVVGGKEADVLELKENLRS